MRTAPLLTTALLFVRLQLGCAAPGSAIGRIYAEGTLALDTGEPIAGRTVEMLLPATYGLGGLDLVMNEPDDFGHKDERFSTQTGPDGKFLFDLGERVYHMTFWLFPPLGGFPRDPPPPFMFLRVPDLGGEYVAVETATARSKLFSKDGAELTFEESALAAVSVSSHSSSADDGRSTTGSVDLVLDPQGNRAGPIGIRDRKFRLVVSSGAMMRAQYFMLEREPGSRCSADQSPRECREQRCPKRPMKFRILTKPSRL